MLVGARVIQRTPSASPPLTPSTVCNMVTTTPQSGKLTMQLSTCVVFNILIEIRDSIRVARYIY